MGFDEKDDKELTIESTMHKISSYLDHCNIELFPVS